jgi:hypothetical protein
MKRFEPCLCGDPECPRCFPDSWRTHRLASGHECYCELADEGLVEPLSFDAWKAEIEARGIDNS